MNLDPNLKKWRINYDQKSRLTSSRKRQESQDFVSPSPMKSGEDGDNMFNKHMNMSRTEVIKAHAMDNNTV
jgi:hypothetical protein